VILRDGVVVGEGATSAPGGAHAEVVALRSAGGSARGATVVVTLEPCAHHGRTPPCTDALIAAGVAEVHALVVDPNPLAAGGSVRLARAGVRVVSGATVHADLAARAADDLRGFLALVAHGRPHLLLKLAQDVVGRTVPAVGGYLTGHAARERVHRLRAEVDAVLVGSRTVAADDPALDVRHVPAELQPVPVVLAGLGDVAPDARVITRGAIVLVGPAAPSERVARLEAAGARVLRVPVTPSGDGPVRLDLAAALAVLPELGVLTVLAEPGSVLARALVAGDLVDVVELHVAGARGAGRPVRALDLSAEVFDIVDHAWAGDDLVIRAARRRDGAAPSAPVAGAA
jgi:diaminohydroxyphosphoribosylaminopyrimidine deaminase/5-amino-6-(5-phosphoribosylamino)uracil reductase